MAFFKDRTEQIDRLSSRLKMDFKATDQWGLHKRLEDFKLFRIGGSHKITNMLHRKDDLETTDFCIFDYSYVISTGKSATTIRQTVFYMHSTSLALPQFWMKPESIFHKLGIWLGLQRDINFVDYPQFSAQYFLKGTDEEYVRATMSDPVLGFFTIEKNWYLEGIGYMMLFYKKGVVLDASEITQLYHKGLKIYDMLQSEPL